MLLLLSGRGSLRSFFFCRALKYVLKKTHYRYSFSVIVIRFKCGPCQTILCEPIIFFPANRSSYRSSAGLFQCVQTPIDQWWRHFQSFYVFGRIIQTCTQQQLWVWFRLGWDRPLGSFYILFQEFPDIAACLIRKTRLTVKAAYYSPYLHFQGKVWVVNISADSRI